MSGFILTFSLFSICSPSHGSHPRAFIHPYLHIPARPSGPPHLFIQEVVGGVGRVSDQESRERGPEGRAEHTRDRAAEAMERAEGGELVLKLRGSGGMGGGEVVLRKEGRRRMETKQLCYLLQRLNQLCWKPPLLRHSTEQLQSFEGMRAMA